MSRIFRYIPLTMKVGFAVACLALAVLWPEGRAASWTVDDSDKSSEDADSTDPDDETMCTDQSAIAVASGNLTEDHTLVSYRSQAQPRALRFIYNSLNADPRPIIGGTIHLDSGALIPDMVRFRLNILDVAQGEPLFVDTRSLKWGSAYDILQFMQFDATAFQTGLYPYTLVANYISSSQLALHSHLKGFVIVQNDRASPFGAGWTLDGVARVHILKDGDVLLTEGNGGAGHFEVDSSASGTFRAPPGDFSSLLRNGDGSFTRTLKDGTQIHFDARGLQTAVIDRNGNMTTYSYDADLLTKITDPKYRAS